MKVLKTFIQMKFFSRFFSMLAVLCFTGVLNAAHLEIFYECEEIPGVPFDYYGFEVGGDDDVTLTLTISVDCFDEN